MKGLSHPLSLNRKKQVWTVPSKASLFHGGNQPRTGRKDGVTDSGLRGHTKPFMIRAWKEKRCLAHRETDCSGNGPLAPTPHHGDSSASWRIPQDTSGHPGYLWPDNPSWTRKAAPFTFLLVEERQRGHKTRTKWFRTLGGSRTLTGTHNFLFWLLLL